METVLCNRILSNLKSQVVSEARSLWGLKQLLKDLGIVVNEIRGKLPDAEEKLEKDDKVGDWLKQLRSILYEADDLVEKISYAAYHRQSMTHKKVISEVCLFFSTFNQLTFGIGMAKQIQKVMDGLNSLIKEGDKIGFCVRPIENRVWESDSPLPLEHTPIGRDEDKQVLVDMLLDSSVEDNIEFIRIVGVGGMGKTTLAQLVYNDAKVKTHFELRIWVSIPERFDIRNIASKIIESATNGTSKPPQDQEVAQLERGINGKLYLLVLDDVWEDCGYKWGQVRELLVGGARGSKILLTTRSTHAGQNFGKTYRLKGLSDEDSWSLFERVAFKQDPNDSNLPEDSELMELGNQIVNKCNNHPFAIRLLGTLLRGESKEVWKFALKYSSESVLPMILTWGYSEIPTNLKPCFAFCSLFPKGYELNKHDLISLWMAQGFIEPRRQSQGLEDAGEEYIMELLWRAFFNAEKDEVGSISACSMYDLIHDLTQEISGNENIMLDSKSISSVSGADRFNCRTRHVSLNYEKNSAIVMPSSLFRASSRLRTFLRLNTQAADSEAKSTNSVCSKLIKNLRCLRVLDLHDFGIEELPGSVAKLLLLRYLDLSNNGCLKELPESITRLYHLQTLKLNFCEKLKRLPRGIGKLVNLTRLEIDDCDSLTATPLGLERLTCLQTLSRFVVGKDGFDPKRNGGLRVLNGLNNLKGKLTIELCGERTNVLEEAAVENLSGKSKLSELRIGWGRKRLDRVNQTRYQALLDGIQALTNLVVLSIEGCKECRRLPLFSQLPLLKCLTLRQMNGVRYMESSKQPAIVEFFPSLQELTLHSFYNLEGWWKTERTNEQVGEEIERHVGEVEEPSHAFFPCLVKLKIWNCPKLMEMPLFPYVEDLYLSNVNRQLLQESGASSVMSTNATSYITSRSTSIAKNFHHLPNLKRLQIKGCPNLKSLPVLAVSESGAVSSLKYLVVDKCNELRSVVEGLQHFSSLEEFEISSCEELDFSVEDNAMPWRSLRRLRYLTFHDIPKMKSLPDGLRHASTLRFLCISSCNNLASLPEWMGSLTSLVHLRVECCRALTKLPNALRDLHCLVKVEITECPELVDKCKEYSGEEWEKIKHARVLLHKSWRYGL